MASEADTGLYVRIGAGTFSMGSPPAEVGRAEDEAPHAVTLIRPLLVKCAPVTQAEWVEVMGFNPSICQGDARPVEKVSWFDAIAYCNALSRLQGLDEAYTLSDVTGQPGEEAFNAVVHWHVERKGYRLPTEAEWEYVARAGTATAFYNGPCVAPRGQDPYLDQIAWYHENSGSKTHPVGLKAPNGWGLHDTLGNVWEWCWDWYGPYPDGPQRDPAGPSGGLHRVLRGGAWYNEAKLCRAAQRYKYSPSGRRSLVGFRPVRSLVSLSGQAWRTVKPTL